MCKLSTDSQYDDCIKMHFLKNWACFYAFIYAQQWKELGPLDDSKPCLISLSRLHYPARSLAQQQRHTLIGPLQRRPSLFSNSYSSDEWDYMSWPMHVLDPALRFPDLLWHIGAFLLEVGITSGRIPCWSLQNLPSVTLDADIWAVQTGAYQAISLGYNTRLCQPSWPM